MSVKTYQFYKCVYSCCRRETTLFFEFLRLIILFFLAGRLKCIERLSRQLINFIKNHKSILSHTNLILIRHLNKFEYNLQTDKFCA